MREDRENPDERGNLLGNCEVVLLEGPGIVVGNLMEKCFPPEEWNLFQNGFVLVEQNAEEQIFEQLEEAPQIVPRRRQRRGHGRQPAQINTELFSFKAPIEIHYFFEDEAARNRMDLVQYMDKIWTDFIESNLSCYNLPTLKKELVKDKDICPARNRKISLDVWTKLQIHIGYPIPTKQKLGSGLILFHYKNSGHVIDQWIV